MKKNTQLKKNLKVGGAIVAGLGALAGAYFLYGTDAGKKKRKTVQSWMLKAKADVLEKIEKIEDLTEEKYMSAIESVMKKYYDLKDKYGDDATILYAELVSYWKHLKKHTANSNPKKVVKTVKAKSVSKGSAK